MTAVWRGAPTKQKYFPRPAVHLSGLLFSSAPSNRQISIDLLINLFIHLSITPHWASQPLLQSGLCYTLKGFTLNWRCSDRATSDAVLSSFWCFCVCFTAITCQTVVCVCVCVCINIYYMFFMAVFNQQHQSFCMFTWLKEQFNLLTQWQKGRVQTAACCLEMSRGKLTAVLCSENEQYKMYSTKHVTNR